MPMALHENPKRDETNDMKITVIQKFGSQNVKGIKCLKRASNIRTPEIFWTSIHIGARDYVCVRVFRYVCTQSMHNK